MLLKIIIGLLIFVVFIAIIISVQYAIYIYLKNEGYTDEEIQEIMNKKYE